jgi:hypothetical protein
MESRIFDSIFYVKKPDEKAPEIIFISGQTYLGVRIYPFLRRFKQVYSTIFVTSYRFKCKKKLLISNAVTTSCNDARHC